MLATLNMMDLLVIGGIIALVAYPLFACRFPAIALAMCPVVIVAMIFAGAVNEEEAQIAMGIVFAAMLLFLTMLGVMASRPKPEDPQWPKALAKFFLVMLAVLAAFAILGLITFMLLPGIGLLLLLIVAVLIVRYVLIAREHTTATVFTTIAAGMRQNLPLSTTLASESAAHAGKRGAILAALSRRMTEGHALSESLRLSYPACPGYALALVATGERIGQLPRALGCIEEHLVARAKTSRKFKSVNPIYGVVVLMIVMVMLGLLMVFVFPRFQDIFAGMGARLPAVTRWLMAVSANHVWLILGPLWLVLLAVIPGIVYTRFRPRRADSPRLLSRWGDFWKWRLPFLHWFEKNYALHQTVSFLRLALRSGATVDEAIQGASMLDLNECYRRRLRDWMKRVREGQDVAAAARQSGVGPALAWAFDTAVNPGNTPAVLESLESFYRAGYSYAANLVRLVFWPCATIALAAVVGTVVYAFFAPLPALLEATMETMVP